MEASGERNKEENDIFKKEVDIVEQPRLVSQKLDESVETIQHDTSNSSDLEIKADLDISIIDERLIQ